MSKIKQDKVISDAARFFSEKGLKVGFDWRDVWKEEHAASFTVAKMMQEDLLKDTQEALYRAMAEGRTFNQFKKEMVPKLMQAGWWGKQIKTDPKTGAKQLVQLGSTARLKLIYQTNMRTARAAGQWQRAQRTKKMLPYFEYVQSTAKAKRDEHLSLVGTILPVDHQFWDIYFPPNGYNCKCGVRQITLKEAERKGISKPPKIEYVDWENKRTGKIEKVPKHVSPGFDHNHGKRRDFDAMLSEKTLDRAKASIEQKIIRSKVERTPWTKDFPDAIIDRTLKEASKHKLYKAAKADDPDAAYQFALDMVTDEAVEKLRKLIDKNTVLLPALAKEEAGENMIPLAVCCVIKDKLGIPLEIGIKQGVKVGRTGKDGWFRLANTPTFTGAIKKGVNVILIDDAITQGGTYAGMKGYVEKQGAKVTGVYALTGKQYSAKLSISYETLKELRNKYPTLEHWWQSYFGFDFSHLTESEAKYIIGAKGETADTIRTRIIASESG